MSDYYNKKAHKYPRLAPTLSARDTALLVATVFWACGGHWWRDKKGYHARAYNRSTAILMPLKQALKGHFFRLPKKQGWAWHIDRKSVVQWLDKNLSMLFQEIPPDESPTCPHCGAEEGWAHDSECYLAERRGASSQ